MRAKLTAFFASLIAFCNDAVIADIECPLLFVHGTDDRLTPITESERLQKAARAPHRRSR